MKVIEIEGKVTKEPQVMEQWCEFEIESEQGLYKIISYDVQAAKDYIFIKRGQHLHIEGLNVINENNLNLLLSKSSRIELKE